MKILSRILDFLSKTVFIISGLIFILLIIGKIEFYNFFLVALLVSVGVFLRCGSFLIQREQRTKYRKEEEKEEIKKYNKFLNSYADFQGKLFVADFIIIIVIIIAYFVIITIDI